MINKPKKFLLAIFITFLATYIMPYSSLTDVGTSYGFPVEFLTIPNNTIDKSLISSTGLNIFALVLNFAFYYIILTCISNIIDKYKVKKANH